MDDFIASYGFIVRKLLYSSKIFNLENIMTEKKNAVIYNEYKTELYKKTAGNEIALRYILKEDFVLLSNEQKKSLVKKVRNDALEAKKLPNGHILAESLDSIIGKLESIIEP